MVANYTKTYGMLPKKILFNQFYPKRKNVGGKQNSFRQPRNPVNNSLSQNAARFFPEDEGGCCFVYCL